MADRQCVEIARALARELRVLILDEPTAALAPPEVARLFEQIRRLVAQGVAVLYISHRLEEVLRISDDITVLRDGKVAAALDADGADRRTVIGHMLGQELQELPASPTPAAGDALLSCEDLSAPPLLQSVSFDVRRGEIVGVFGMVGAGQESIGEALFGLRSATAKRVALAGLARLPRSPREAIAAGVGYVPADRKQDGLALRLSVRENLLLAGRRRLARAGVIDAGRERRVAEELVTRYRIRTPSTEVLARALSGGNQQKLVLAKWAISGDTRLMLLAEPTRGVDVGAKAEVYRLLRRFATDGGAGLLLSTDPEEAATLCDRVYVMHRGRITADMRGDQITVPAMTAAAL